MLHVEWRAEMSWDELITLRDRLSRMLQYIRRLGARNRPYSQPIRHCTRRRSEDIGEALEQLRTGKRMRSSWKAAAMSAWMGAGLATSP